MSFTPIGVIIILLGLIAFVYSTKWLFVLAVFFIPFSGTAVINLGSAVAGSSIQPYMFLGSLCIAKGGVLWLVNRNNIIKATVDRYQFWAKVFFAAFAFIAGCSLIMPVIINGSTLGNVYGNYMEFEPIIYHSRNLTQFLYFLLGTCFAYFVGFYASKDDMINLAIKTFSYSIIFIMLWGLLEFICQRTGISYPVSVFNNGANETLAKETKFLDEEGGISRLTSVCAEPSILAQQLVVFLPFVLVSIEKKCYIFSPIKDYLLAATVIVFIFLTTSSSGMVCVALLLFVFVLSKRDNFTTKGILRLALQFIAILLSLPIIYLIIPDVIDSALLNKSDSWSALERLDTIVNGWRNFTEYPILGVGWGAITVNDFMVRILSNTGIIGFLFLLLTLYNIVMQNTVLTKKVRAIAQNVYLNRACILAFFILLFNCEIAGFSFYFGIFWLILGLCMANKSKLSY